MVNKLAIAALLSVVTLGAHAQTVNINLTDVITPATAIAVKYSLAGLTNKDTVNVIIRSPGGDLESGEDIALSLLRTPAKTVCRADHYAASAAAVILMSCSVKQVDIGGSVLFHLPYVTLPSLGIKGDPTKAEPLELPEGFKIRNVDVNRQMITFLEGHYCLSKVLTKDEYLTFILGGDVTVLGNEFNKEIKNACRRV